MTTDQPTDPRVAFRRGALDAIPYNLIDSPAVGVGDARRYMLADAMWPVAEPLLAAACDRGLAEGRRQATEGKRLVVEWGARVDEPHPARHEKVGDVIKLGEPSARHAPTIWAGWTTVRRDRLVGPWEPDEQPEGGA